MHRCVGRPLSPSCASVPSCSCGMSLRCLAAHDACAAGGTVACQADGDRGARCTSHVFSDTGFDCSCTAAGFTTTVAAGTGDSLGYRVQSCQRKCFWDLARPTKLLNFSSALLMWRVLARRSTRRGLRRGVGQQCRMRSEPSVLLRGLCSANNPAAVQRNTGGSRRPGQSVRGRKQRATDLQLPDAAIVCGTVRRRPG